MGDEKKKEPRKPATKRSKKRKASASDAPPSSSATPVIRVGAPLKWTLAIFAAVAVSAAVLFFVVYPEQRGPSAGREVELELLGDESADAIAARLASAGVIQSPRIFSFYIRARGLDGTVARGPHLLADDLTPRELLARLSKRAGMRAKVAVPEGFTHVDIAKRLHSARICSRKAFTDAVHDKALLTSLRIEGASAEGYLFPATYDFPQDSLASDVVRRMKLEFDKRFAALEEKHGGEVNDLQSSLGFGRKDIVTLASMVEKEAAVDDERPIIAGVFLNRLRDPKFTPKLLQSDPTAAYGCIVDPAVPSCRTFTGKITHALLNDADNLYSTYKHPGLPPGPIANPGARSLEAVMAPASTRALYFVAKGGGRHTFSETYEAHQAAIKGKAPDVAPAPTGEATNDDAAAR